MEELQDALEDAQYVNAIHVYEGPRPMKRWPVATDDGMNEWKRDLMRKWEQSPNRNALNKPFGFFWVLSSSLGFYLFSSFIRDTTDEHLHINFVEDVLRWRMLIGNEHKLVLQKIVTKYLLPCSIDSGTDQVCPPTTSLIKEYLLVYKPVGTVVPPEKLADLVEKNISSMSEKSCIGLDGKVRNDILSSFQSDSFSSLPCRPEMKMNLDKSDNSREIEKILRVDETEDFRTDEEKAKELKESYANKSAILTEEMETTEKMTCSSSEDDIFNLALQIILEYIRIKHWETFVDGDNEQWSKLMKLLWKKDQPVVAEDFFPMRVLGRGGFGLVTACKKTTTGKLYAMKVMKKKRIQQKKSQQLARNERSVLAAVDSPFVVNLKYAFETKSDLYLVMDLMIGGDLSFHLNQKGQFSKEECLYYAARITLGLQALHEKNYVYRDLKPENCLLAEDGRVRLTDLGLTTKIHKKLNGAAGTRGYWAPEMIEKNKYGKRRTYDQRVDWFSLGCVISEMISGKNPFRSEAALNFGRSYLDEGSTKEQAVDFATLKYEPSFKQSVFEESACDLCRQLLTKNPNKRLGALGHKEIMRHRWFNDLDWDMILSDRQKPPFIPSRDINAASQSEIGNFERSGVKLDKNDETYRDWEWVNENVFEEEVMDMLIYERESGQLLTPMSEYSSSCCCCIS